jgi:hypothetical protein
VEEAAVLTRHSAVVRDVVCPGPAIGAAGKGVSLRVYDSHEADGEGMLEKGSSWDQIERLTRKV